MKGAVSLNKKAPVRKISANAKKDFAKATAFYKEQLKTGWTDDSCNSAAGRFESVASDHPKLVEARYNAGLSYQHCKMYKKAEGQYQAALKIIPHGPSLSNLGEIYFLAGKRDSAKTYWARSIQADSKITAARNNQAWLLLEQLRATTDKSTWKKIEKDTRAQLSNVLAVDNDNVEAYILYGLVYMEGSERNRSRLELAKVLMDKGSDSLDAKIKAEGRTGQDAANDARYAPLHNARGLYYMRRDNLGAALKKFQQAVAADGSFLEARMNVGNITLGFRKYDTALTQFSKVLENQPNNYDAHIGLGIAQRGLGKLSEAEASYKKALGVDGRRGAAAFNLGVLYKDFHASKATGLKDAQVSYRTALNHFKNFMSKKGSSRADIKEAKVNIKDCEKIIKQLGEVMIATEKAAAEMKRMEAEDKAAIAEEQAAEERAKKKAAEEAAKKKKP